MQQPQLLPSQSDPLLGRRVLGSYVIARQIGKGGMGAVYEARNPTLGTRLAVKVLLQQRASSEVLVHRFFAEARAATAIQHRNIIQILDASTFPDGNHYIVMEFVEGQTLQAYLERVGAIPLEASLAILAQVCSGLEAAHNCGILHRDLKPANLLIAPQPDNPLFTKILDFGIAKLANDALSDGFRTNTHASAGTPSYTSPEQARALRDVSPATDVYSLGVIAYRMAAGRLPYRVSSLGDLVHQHARVRPPRLTQIVPGLPAGYCELVESAIALDPNNRPLTMGEFALTFMGCVEGGDEIVRRVAPLLLQRPVLEVPVRPPALRLIPRPLSATESLGEGQPGRPYATATTCPGRRSSTSSRTVPRGSAPSVWLEAARSEIRERARWPGWLRWAALGLGCMIVGAAVVSIFVVTLRAGDAVAESPERGAVTVPPEPVPTVRALGKSPGTARPPARKRARAPGKTRARTRSKRRRHKRKKSRRKPDGSLFKSRK